ncbi:tyrosine--tRNA ligase [Aureibacter tunicatorum]|uniref:Tyrosine--tRNA ligase n=1 Tax=Aureibacter tunicatorum TaxID=866807 RepID=A0AAE3XJY6_9BACT|nr:tyrosine--tRNA ligase [Aureibacter tunicatorum]MDR6239166.1 tyrosyl-tRNA synthetase [Aureibacter tunicatorum]BDD04908.1 tyrosine--tRNA ligase [Aureibacter tunicatorum]
MKKNFVEELRWRGMLHDAMPGTEEQLNKEITGAYVGIDPTADSLHIGHLVSVMMLKHFQLSGHKPYALIGGATGMIGDPSGKSEERNLLNEETLQKNQDGIKKQLSKFLDFDSQEENSAELVNNYDWMKEFSFLDFAREVGKHITVNYMMAKESVKKRLSQESKVGMSFTEFTYQLLQGYDFYHLNHTKNVKLQMGGSDQWGNIVTGTELIRRKSQGDAFALTCPLITKADGRKFGKTEKGNIWLDPEKTSPYEFYQFWLNTSDEDAAKYIKIFTFLSKEKIESLLNQHNEAPHQRALQKKLAEEITTMVHSAEDLEMAQKASQILFGKSTTEDLASLNEKTLLAVFDGVPQKEITEAEFNEIPSILDLISVALDGEFIKSKGEARKLVKGGGISINKSKLEDAEQTVDTIGKLQEKYILLQKGKKNYFLIKIS